MQAPSPSVGKADGRGVAPATRYKGVRLREWGSWVTEVRRPNSRARIWLGSYHTAEKAARAYDAAVLCLRGPRATFNFPDCLPVDIPTAGGGAGARCLTDEEIREVAARHAGGAAVPRRLAEREERTGDEGADVGDWGGNLYQWPEDPLAGFPSPTWTVHYEEEADASFPDDSTGGGGYSLWSFGPDDWPPFGNS